MATNLHPNSGYTLTVNNIVKWCCSFYGVTQYAIQNVSDIRG